MPVCQYFDNPHHHWPATLAVELLDLHAERGLGHGAGLRRLAKV